jgi:hypothetical protein
MYYAIIGDIRNSRKLTNRAKIQNQLIQTIQKINQKYHMSIEKDMAIMQGDDFQVLLNKPDHIFMIMHEIMMGIPEIDIRFGIGIGDLAFNYNDGSSDGKVWWHARDALDDLKQNNKYHILMMINGLDKKINTLCNQLLINTSLIQNNWTNSQKQFVYQLIDRYGLNDKIIQKDVAQTLGYSNSTISEKLSSTNYYAYIKNIKIIINTLKEG